MSEASWAADMAAVFSDWAASEGLLATATEEQVASLSKAFMYGALVEHKTIRELADKVQATYWVGPDSSLAPHRPFKMLLDEFLSHRLEERP